MVVMRMMAIVMVCVCADEGGIDAAGVRGDAGVCVDMRMLFPAIIVLLLCVMLLMLVV